ncbi:hypothetical protein K502DRAFT_324721 [Neoconidiobolus thromboides FSU 785]|nr:hypothetical protein K502DRAFT_324721 [Neoconidiobolus thromboides FSU 785]
MTKTKQDYIVTSLPYVNDYFISDNKQYAGEIELFNKVNYFFWLFTKNKPRGKLLIWLNGGPGW